MVVADGRVFAVGGVEPVPGSPDFVVRAYDAMTGALLWEDEFDKSGSNDQASAVATALGRVFAAGFATNAAGDTDFLLRVYDALGRRDRR